MDRRVSPPTIDRIDTFINEVVPSMKTSEILQLLFADTIQMWFMEAADPRNTLRARKRVSRALFAELDARRPPHRAIITTTIDDRVREANERAARMGVPPLDRARFVTGCEFHEFCSPYMRQSWAHDSRCPLSDH